MSVPPVVVVNRSVVTVTVGPAASGGASLGDDLTAIEALTGTGVARRTGDGQWTLDVGLESLAGVDSGANLLPYTTGADAWAGTTLSAFARTLLDDADAEAARTTLGITEWTTASLAADQTNNDTTPVTATGLEFTPQANALYEVDAVLFFMSASTSVGYQAGLWGLTSGATWDTQSAVVAAGVGTTATRQGPMGAVAATTAVSSVAHVYVARLQGFVKTGASPNGTISARFQPEIAGTIVTTLAGSFLRYRRLS